MLSYFFPRSVAYMLIISLFFHVLSALLVIAIFNVLFLISLSGLLEEPILSLIYLILVSWDQTLPSLNRLTFV